jgi:hypothetical protein
VAEGLHLLEAIVCSPLALATLLEAAGPGAEEQVAGFAPAQALSSLFGCGVAA